VVGTSSMFIFTVVTAKKSAENSGFPSRAFCDLFRRRQCMHGVFNLALRFGEKQRTFLFVLRAASSA